MRHILSGLRKASTLRGRAAPVEAWSFYFFCLAIQVAALLLDLAMGWQRENVVPWLPWYPALEITRILLLVPALSVTTRRLHDVNESGWKALLWFIPIFGWLHLLPLLAQDGDSTTNPYGPPPNAGVHPPQEPDAVPE